MDQRFFRNGFESGIFSKNSPFRFFGSKSIEDERVALMKRFRSEGLDGRKLNDAQMLPFVWQWLADAEINCKSLRHQIDKMKRQHDEELQEVGDYVEQVWKLSTEKLIFLEAENANLKEHQNRHLNNHHHNSRTRHHHRRSLTGEDDDDIINAHDDPDDDDDYDDDDERENSETESRNHNHRYNHKNDSTYQQHNNRILSQTQQYRRPMITSASTSSLGTSTILNFCDNLQTIRSSQSSSQLSDLINRASLKLNTPEIDNKHNLINANNSDFCEKCELLNTELIKSHSKVLELDGTIEELSEKCFILEKLNRNIELENENFSFKLAEAENRSNDLERKILNLEKEQNRSNASKTNEHTTRVLVQELNLKIKKLEEEMDLRNQLYEELEMKYQKQKEKHQETLWKLRNYIHDKESQNSVDLFGASNSDGDSGHKSSESGFSQRSHFNIPNSTHRSIDKLV